MTKIKQIIQDWMKNESIDAFSGLVTKIDNIHDYLTFVTMETPTQQYNGTRFPFYAKLGQEYNGKFVDVRITRRGRLEKEVEQEIIGSNCSYKTTMPKKRVDNIIRQYRIQNQL